MLGNKKPLTAISWPDYEREIASEDVVTLVVQINGKLRSRVTLPAGADEELVREHALADEKVRSFLDGKEVKRVIVVPDRLVNIVVAEAVVQEP